DSSQDLVDRLNALNINAFGGLFLVLIVLTLFLRFHLAIWVAAGIPIAILGALMLFPPLELSISTMAVMSFILVLGIVVDDAIVVGERVYAHERDAEDHRTAAIAGTYEISMPVIFGVLTTIAAFLPLLMLGGRMGTFFGVIGTVVIVCLVFSILESQIILPSHLAHRQADEDKPPKQGLHKKWEDFQESFAKRLEYFAEEIYRPFLQKALAWRYFTLSCGLAILILVGALIASGRIGIQFFPAVEGKRVSAQLTMPQGVPLEVTENAVKQLEASLEQLRADIDARRPPGSPSIIRHVLSSIGARLDPSGPSDPRQIRAGGSHIAEVSAELVPYNQRDISSAEVAALWREKVGTLPDAVKLNFNSDAFSAGTALAIQLSGADIDELRTAATELKAELGRYDGVYDISDSFLAGKQEVQLTLRDDARPLGLTQLQLARQVRQGFYGEEVQRVQRGVDDMRIMVRYPENERQSLGNMEDMWIRTADGMEIPFTSVAEAELGRGYAAINRTDRKRTVTVTADSDRAIASPESILASIQANDLPKILAKHPGVKVSLEGEQRERIRTFSTLPRALGLALMIIFALLAIPLRSYLQPLVIMSVIPFGAVGALFGHFIMGVDLVFFSVLGIVALSGVVVNSSLVLVDYINRQRRQGVPLYDAVATAGVVRFRPIFL
ncbi:MAG: efflux RND transporter permease subunit, partial [Pseudomonadota bacterium]